MMLKGKSAVLYGANSSTGAAIARALAREGATVYLAGRTTSKLQPVARAILDAGGAAEVAAVDPMDATSVAEHLHQVMIKHGQVDLSLNLAFLGVEGATRLCNLSDEQFAAVAFTRVRSNFVTMAAAVREMSYQGHGTVLATAVPERGPSDDKRAGQVVGSAAIEALCEQLRHDVGSFGVRIAYLPDAAASDEVLIEQLLGALTLAPAVSAAGDGIAGETAAATSGPLPGATAGA